MPLRRPAPTATCRCRQQLPKHTQLHYPHYPHPIHPIRKCTCTHHTTPHLAAQHVEEGGLAGAAGAKDGVEAAGGEAAAHALWCSAGRSRGTVRMAGGADGWRGGEMRVRRCPAALHRRPRLPPPHPTPPKKTTTRSCPRACTPSRPSPAAGCSMHDLRPPPLSWPMKLITAERVCRTAQTHKPQTPASRARASVPLPHLHLHPHLQHDLWPAAAAELANDNHHVATKQTRHVQDGPSPQPPHPDLAFCTRKPPPPPPPSPAARPLARP